MVMAQPAPPKAPTPPVAIDTSRYTALLPMFFAKIDLIEQEKDAANLLALKEAIKQQQVSDADLLKQKTAIKAELDKKAILDFSEDSYETNFDYSSPVIADIIKDYVIQKKVDPTKLTTFLITMGAALPHEWYDVVVSILATQPPASEAYINSYVLLYELGGGQFFYEKELIAAFRKDKNPKVLEALLMVRKQKEQGFDPRINQTSFQLAREFSNSTDAETLSIITMFAFYTRDIPLAEKTFSKLMAIPSPTGKDDKSQFAAIRIPELQIRAIEQLFHYVRNEWSLRSMCLIAKIPAPEVPKIVEDPNPLFIFKTPAVETATDKAFRLDAERRIKAIEDYVPAAPVADTKVVPPVADTKAIPPKN